MGEKETAALLERLFGDRPWPRPYHLLQGLALVDDGTPVADAAKIVKTSEAKLKKFIQANNRLAMLQPMNSGTSDPVEIEKRRNAVGRVLLSKAAELAFEDIYRSQVKSEFRLVDLRDGRTDTDYRMFNGNNHPVFRINIKFFGSLFEKAAEMVKLETSDCFPLATYKIHAGLVKQEKDQLPFVFLIVCVPQLTMRTIAQEMPRNDLDAVVALLLSATERIRDIEDRYADACIREGTPAFVRARQRMAEAPWYVISAKKASKIMHEKLFDRVYALTVPRFAQQWKHAELNMHFSLRNDLSPMGDFLKVIRDEGIQKATSMCWSGAF